MNLSDIMAAAGLTTWPEIALILFFLSFCGIVLYLFVFRRNRPYRHEASLPLEDAPSLSEEDTDGGMKVPENGHA